MVLSRDNMNPEPIKAMPRNLTAHPSRYADVSSSVDVPSARSSASGSIPPSPFSLTNPATWLFSGVVRDMPATKWAPSSVEFHRGKAAQLDRTD